MADDYNGQWRMIVNNGWYTVLPTSSESYCQYLPIWLTAGSITYRNNSHTWNQRVRRFLRLHRAISIQSLWFLPENLPITICISVINMYIYICPHQSYLYKQQILASPIASDSSHTPAPKIHRRHVFWRPQLSQRNSMTAFLWSPATRASQGAAVMQRQRW